MRVPTAAVDTRALKLCRNHKLTGASRAWRLTNKREETNVWQREDTDCRPRSAGDYRAAARGRVDCPCACGTTNATPINRCEGKYFPSVAAMFSGRVPLARFPLAVWSGLMDGAGGESWRAERNERLWDTPPLIFLGEMLTSANQRLACLARQVGELLLMLYCCCWLLLFVVLCCCCWCRRCYCCCVLATVRRMDATISGGRSMCPPAQRKSQSQRSPAAVV